jgi:hypothetical protein
MDARIVKVFKRLITDESMMVRFNEEHANGAPVGVCDRDGEPAASAAT